MRIKMVKAIFKKEMIDILRDKKTLFMGIVLPLILYPIIMVIMTQVMSLSMNSASQREINIAFENKPSVELVSMIENYSDEDTSRINIVYSDDYKKDLEDGSIDAYIGSKMDNSSENYEVYINSSKENASSVKVLLDEIFTSYKDSKVKNKLEESGLKVEETLEPVEFDTVDVAGNEEIAGYFLGQVLPVILMMGVLLGAIYPAIDSMAGEKERGTLETLFTLPISNLELVMGKYIAVSFCAIVTSIFNIISILLTLSYLLVSSQMSGVMLIENFKFSQLVAPMLITLICVCLFAMVIAAVSMCVCSLAKSFKDAQNYITPVMFLVLIPSYASIIPTMVLNRTTAIIPVVNISLLIKSVLSFEGNLGLISLVFISNLAFVILAVFLLSKMFNSEEILFGNSRSFSFLEKRSNIKKGTMPSVSDGIILYAFGLVMLIYVGSLVQLKFGVSGIIMTQLMIIGLPLLFAYYIKSDFKKVFSFKLPSIRHMVASFCLWVGTYMGSMIITQIVLYIFPQNMEVVEGLNNVLLSEDNIFISLLIIAVMPAICEEVFFRGFILTSFRNNKKTIVGAVIGSGILFGLMHMDFIRIIPTSLLGISFAYVVCKSDSIITSMFMHFLNNGFALVVTYFASKFISVETQITPSITLSQIIIYIFISVIFLYIGIRMFNIKKSKELVDLHIN